MKKIYRFRNAARCLEEIKGEYFYFSGMKDLNDPMEGFRDFFFTKDHLLWNKLINLYFVYLHHTIKNESSFKDIGEYWNSDSLVDEYIKNHASIFSKELKAFSEVTCQTPLKESSLCHSDLLYEFIKIGYCMIITILKGDKNYNKTSPLQPLMMYLDANIFGYCYGNSFRNLPPPFDLDSKIFECLNVLLSCLPKEVDFNEISIVMATQMTKKKYPYTQWHYVLPNLIIEFLNKLKNIMNDNVGILCFSSDYSDPLMWSHYADNHKGVSLIFDLEVLQKDLKKEKNQEFFFSEVTYDNDHLSLNWFDSSLPFSKNKETYIKSHLFKKITNWSYEQEYRIITHTGEKVEYNYNALSGIIFGMKITAQEICDFISLIFELNGSEHMENFNFNKAVYCKRTNKIQIQKIELDKIIKLITFPMNR